MVSRTRSPSRVSCAHSSSAQVETPPMGSAVIRMFIGRTSNRAGGDVEQPGCCRSALRLRRAVAPTGRMAMPPHSRGFTQQRTMGADALLDTEVVERAADILQAHGALAVAVASITAFAIGQMR